MRFKERSEDFCVSEAMMLPLLSKGKYMYFLLRKTDWATFDALRKISLAAHIPFGQIGYSGLKDKRAVTEQYLSVPSSLGKRLERVRLPRITLTFVGYGEERITLGMVTKNRFRIVVRDLDTKRTLMVEKVKNTFDTQRFQGNSLSVGKALVQQNFSNACALLHLPVEGKDFLGALRKIHRRFLRFYLSAYQSWLWNKVAQEVPGTAEHVPLLGYLTRFSDPFVASAYKRLMKDEHICLEHFLMKPFPELSTPGGERALYFPVYDFHYQWSDDSSPGTYACTLEFSLPKGCYATLVIKHLFKEQ